MTNQTEQATERYRRVESLYQSALDLPPKRRHEFLCNECDGEPALQREVELLLDHFEAAKDSFLNTPAHGLAAHVIEDESLPDRIGRYNVRGKLGEGGMGVVYRAEQDSPKREVALKVIRSGIASRNLLRRFELEATVLGRLKHPGIAQIYEASTYDSGTGKRPFFAMELVEGPPLNSYVAQNGLHTRARLDLFLKICDAVNHAHQKGVIHRDLKPGNILVTSSGISSTPAPEGRTKASLRVQGGPSGDPKILDFGVARAIDSDLQATTLQTDVRQVVGTLPYMSPEQVEGQAHLLDVRSDIYALGVILYELLAGHVPFQLDGKTVAAAARVICDDEPPPLSTINTAYRGDLNTIVLKALEKDPERRYQSVSDLAADVRRYLNDETITARPATTIYQLRKFFRRNRGLVAGVCAAFVVLVLGVIVSVSFAVQRSRALDEANRQRDIAVSLSAERERALNEAQRQRDIAVSLSAERERALDEANRQRDIAEAVNEFVDRDLLANANPSNEPNRAISLREVVDRAADKIGERFSDQPMVEATIRTTLANTYKGLGEYAEATVHAKAALKCLESISTEPSYELLLTMNRVASLEKAQGHWTQAEEMFRRALAMADQAFGPEHETTMSITNNLALLLERKQEYDEAAALLKPLLERRIRLLGEEHEHTMITMNNLALLYVSMERYDDAERLHLRELALSTKVMGPEHPGTLISKENLAVLYANQELFEKAEPLLREVIASRTRVLGPDHPATFGAMANLGYVLCGLKQHKEAESLLLDASAGSEEKLGADHPLTLRARTRLATLYLQTDRLDEAESIARDTYERRKRAFGESDGDTGVTLGLLARICSKRGKLQEAETLGRRSYEIVRDTYGPEHSKARKVAEELSEVDAQLGQTDEAEHWRSLAGD